MKFEYHVKPTGSDAACGDAEHPFATISKAAQVAAPAGYQRLGMRAGLDGIGRSSACVDGGA